LGINIDGKVSIDMKAVKKRVQANIQNIYEEDDSPEALEKLGVHVITGTAKFIDSKTLSVCDGDNEAFEVCANDGIFIATGAKPNPP